MRPQGVGEPSELAFGIPDSVEAERHLTQRAERFGDGQRLACRGQSGLPILTGDLGPAAHRERARRQEQRALPRRVRTAQGQALLDEDLDLLQVHVRTSRSRPRATPYGSR